MITVPTSEQVEARLETLPERLVTPLFSFEDTQIEEQIALANKVPADKVQSFTEVVAWVFLGFLHSSGIPEALQERAGMSPEAAKAAAAELNEKLLKAYAADLEKVYTSMTGAPAAPSRMADIGPSPMPPKVPMPAPVPLSAVSSGPTASSAHFNRPTPSTFPAPIPPAGPKPWQPTKLNIPKPPNAGPIPVPVPTAAPAAPAPFMMREESSVAPLAAGSDFKLTLSKDMFRSTPSKPIEVPRPPKAAELEIGKAPLPPKPGGGTLRITPGDQSRVVHYTDMRTVIAPGINPAQPSASTAMPATAKPVMPPATPKPSTPMPSSLPSIQPAQPHIMPPVQAAPKTSVVPPKPISVSAAPNPPAPIFPASPAAAKPVMPPAAPLPAATPQADIPRPPKPPKVVNFGPEEVK